eukprot:TRINITY_DN1301_c0_g4_i1.p1 TRINITY_DN1301_c0_g4~~TRINITY_DN1301_c0_g4_i1.p1  ORF type:complete len:561 (+),score=118.62 TRINITY_DN1301_c0_g4_i1:81-1763(+)
MASFHCYMFTVLLLSQASFVTSQSPLASGIFLAPTTGNTVNSEDIRVGIDRAVQKLINLDAETQRRSEFIESAIASTIQALPKNNVGRLEPLSVRYVVHSYFAKVHGWRIEGLEPHSVHAELSEVHSVSVLREKLPTLVELILEDRQSGRGLAPDHVVLMVYVLEQLLFQESLALLPKLYFANGFNTADEIDEDGMREVLISYLMSFRQGTNAKLDSVDYHMAYKASRMQGPLAEALVTFAQDTMINFEYKNRNRMNPFEQPWYKYDHAVELVLDLAHNYGKWQDGDCRKMKEHLVKMGTPDTGRVALDVFHGQTSDGTYNFRESQEYLKSVGALDMSNRAMPQVRLVNYVLGPTNCIARNSFFSVCCISECEEIMGEIEVHVQAPKASPEHLLRIISNISTSSVDAPRTMKLEMVMKLRRIADRNGGSVPLYGRLFMQWLHFAFPNECPYPDVVESRNLMPSRWARSGTVASKEELDQLKQSSYAMSIDSEDQDIIDAEWSDEEVLPLQDSRSSLLAKAFGFAVKLSPIVLVLQGAMALFRSARKAHDATVDGKTSSFV